MALHVFNTRTKQKEPFVPADPKVVRIYTCGLTVYSHMHIGHARTYCFWDVFRRWLEYRGYHVISVINYTDIDDRIISDAANGGTGMLDHAERIIASFRQDCRALNIKDYATYTRATDFVAEQIDAVQALLDKGHAYVSDGEVLYDVRSFERYGELSGRTIEALQEGASGRTADAERERKRFFADFTLWKPSKPGEPSWETGKPEWPSGRPGWHIECSVMSTTTLGAHFDVHGGGIDNLFPHHENEVAQAEPLCGHPWVGYWMHPAHLQLLDESNDPVKMSKSLGNVISIPELVKNHSADQIRWFFGVTHYRSSLAFNWQLLAESSKGFEKIKRAVGILERRLEQASDAELNIPVQGTYASLRSGDQAIPRERESFVHGAFGEASARFIERFIAGMDDDMGTSKATAALFDYVGELFVGGIEASDDVPSLLAAYRCLTRHLWVLGAELPNPRLYPELAVECTRSADAGGGDEAERVAALGGVIDKLLEARQDARKAKDFAKSDLIRDLLQAAGVAVEDTPKGARWQLG
ncbi:Cysteinyl-tRNA synthetase [Enhygromyxa salina]|uniref:Cysteine--tRNA ligase n=1 Tax=Enhygromyxa salina TaxID=215803 RepID=A0A0C1Z3E9_9BACT|nr:cysteine--tRNA ligase [Enhygromyxa salina]KIG12124.1 Cysteinyl-tRNA synthetase [Enhygromyxa salina]